MYHVSCMFAEKPHELKKKRLTVTDKDAIKNGIISLFEIPPDRDVLLQSFDEEFQDWLDIDDIEALPNKGKLKVTVCAGQSIFRFVLMKQSLVL